VKLVIISNRLPVSLSEEEDGFHFAQSPGGLASGLRAFLSSPGSLPPSGYVWVGWPGCPVTPAHQAEVTGRCREEFSAWPVFLSPEDTEAFYEGFSNSTLWPLFHYFPSLVSYREAHWAAYERVNRDYCEAALAVIEPGDLVWVHDYHLLLLPAMLKQKVPHLRVGFFLHIPFPSYEIFRLLPSHWRSALLEGMLGSDLVGFHTHDYTLHFLKSVRRILGQEHEMGQIILADRVVEAETFPMGIDFETFSAQAGAEEVIKARDDLRQSLGAERVVLSVDRLDYTKGIANRLLAYRDFLQANPSWHTRVALLMVVVPSRTGVEDYQRMKSQVDELVGNINGTFGTPGWTPVVYQYRSFPQDQLLPMFAASDVMLVTPLRDGMNLVAKEYIASRADDTGVLILSEMAGAASELGEALTINPNDIPGMTGTIQAALEMPADVQRENMLAMRERLRRYDVVRWAREFLSALREESSGLERHVLTATMTEQLVREFRSASRRLVLCDYDGTLVPLRLTPGQAQPSPELLATVARIAAVSDVVIVSGRPRATLDSWFGRLPVSLVAEHGALIRERDQDWSSTQTASPDWKPKVRNLMELYVDRLPGAFVEEKEYTLAWHYRQADADLALLRAKELAAHLLSLTEASDLKVVEGSKVIEVRPSSLSKGKSCLSYLARGYDFVLAMGDDTTDEDLFRALPETAWSLRIGLGRSHARFNVYNQRQARRLLDALVEASDQPPSSGADEVHPPKPAT
jgi:trehalose 6-phosphate synthase/phosphatase